MNLLRLIKRPIIRILLITWGLFFILNQFHFPQFLNNLLATPVLIWMVYAIYSALRQAKLDRLQLIADIKSYSQVNQPSLFDTCEGSAIALNYEQKTIFLIDGKLRKSIPLEQFLGWEMNYNGGGGVAAFAASGNPSSMAGQAAIGAAIGYGIFSVLGYWLNRRKDIGHIKFWINDAERSMVSVYVSNDKIVEQLQHFSMANGLKVE